MVLLLNNRVKRGGIAKCNYYLNGLENKSKIYEFLGYSFGYGYGNYGNGYYRRREIKRWYQKWEKILKRKQIRSIFYNKVHARSMQKLRF
jgi:hypothetical protein